MFDVNPIMTAIRTICALLDTGAFLLLKFSYELFFNIATFNLIDREMIFNLFSRVQLIIGVFMVFQLTMTIIKGIVNPDSFTDSKSGAGNLIMRIMISLTLLALIVPLNISSPRNEYEKQINNNGVLFGTLYSLQYRILSNNTLGKLILGDDASNYTSSDPDNDSLNDFATRFTTVIVKTFYKLNTDEDGEYVCNDDFEDEYNDEDTDPLTIIWHGMGTCGFTIMGSEVADSADYQLSVVFLISTIAGAALAILLFIMTFNVAKRVFQLAALQLMAPIPIISYMDPKGSKDSAFSSWVKLLGTTYLELFIQVGVIYLAFGIINSFIDRFPELMSSTVEGAASDILMAPSVIEWTFIIMCIALFIFAKDAPKFFKQMLGLKDNGGSFFSAFGTAMGLGASAVGAIGSARAGYQSSLMADQTRQSLGVTDRKGRVVDPNSNFNKAKHVLSGLVGGVTGAATGAGAALSAKDHNTKAAWDAMQKRNATAMARGNDGSTLFGRMGSMARSTFMGEGAAAGIDRQIATNKSRVDALKALQSRVKGEMVKKDWTQSIVGKQDKNTGAWSYFMKDVSGADVTGAINYKDFMARKNAAASSGLTQFTIKTTAGDRVISMDDANRYEGLIMKGNENDYIEQQVLDVGARRAGVDDDARFATLKKNADNLGGPDGGSADFTRDSDGTIKKGKNKKITNRDSIWEAIEAFEDYNVQLSQKNAINKANDQYSGTKK